MTSGKAMHPIFYVSFASLFAAILGARQSSREGDKPSADSANAS